ncbi:hypothetical protein GIB67_022441 [Kingdonia uniflora]|uniref:Uncharacterized protein n=1 Tax=Kingdonia uniflora TaxID=39325 RepID=A0A7J7MTW1_9MAGN|nr:hypothetical protein GIB67_022441 [Kingdonia uniflora]
MDHQSERARVAKTESRRWLYSSMVREGFGVATDSHSDIEVDMRSPPVSKASTSGHSDDSEIKTSGSEEEGGVDQFPVFPGRLIIGRQFRGCTVAMGEEYFNLLADLVNGKRARGIKESISFEYFDGDVQTELSKCFLRYLSQLEYGLSLPLSNLVKGIMNLIGGCPVRMNGNMWKVKRKESLLDTVVQEEIELEAILEDLGISRKKYANSRVDKDFKSQSTRLMTSVDSSKKKGTDGERVKVVGDRPIVEDDWKEVKEKVRLAALHGEKEMSKMAARLMKGIYLGVEEERAELKRKKVELERNIARLKSDLSKEGKLLEALKASQVV